MQLRCSPVGQIRAGGSRTRSARLGATLSHGRFGPITYVHVKPTANFAEGRLWNRGGGAIEICKASQRVAKIGMAFTCGALRPVEFGIVMSTPHHQGSRHFEEGARWDPIHPAGEGVCKGALAGSDVLVSPGSYTSQ